jgi:ABC-type Fe3+/spermidine/putrescine transport system ATPase subunit
MDLLWIFITKSAFVSSFIGKNNTIVEGRAVEVTADVIKVKVGEWRLESTNFDQSINIGQNVSIIIRPEEVFFHASDMPLSPNSIKGTVLAKTFLGSEMRFHIDIGFPIEVLVSNEKRNLPIEIEQELFLDITNPLVFPSGYKVN